MSLIDFFFKRPKDIEEDGYRLEYKFAWRPVYIRNATILGCYSNPHWSWLRRYTRISMYSHRLGRYRTQNTVLGWIDRNNPNIG